MRRDWMAGLPTASSEEEGTVRYFGKPETQVKTPWVRGRCRGITDSKEVFHIKFSGKGPPPGSGLDKRKGIRSAVAERVFVRPDKIYFGQDKASDVHLFVGHTSGPKGPQSNLTYYEYVEGATLDFDIMVADDFISPEWWGFFWALAEENGLGALRSQGFGVFDVEMWRKIPTMEALKDLQATTA